MASFLFKHGKYILLLVLVSFLATLFFATFLGTTSGTVDGLKFRLQITPSTTGITTLTISPLGEIKAKTHKTPLKLNVSLERLNLSQLKSLLEDSDQEILKDLEKDAYRVGNKFLVRLLVLASLGAALACFLVFRNARASVAGLILGFSFMIIVVGLTYSTFDVRGFRQPQYTGVLRASPWLMGAIQQRFDTVEAFQDEIRNIATNIYRFYSKVESWEPVSLERGAIAVLHVSDIHNNPAAIELVKRVAQEFSVSFIIDTGDITDFGSDVEADLAARVEDLGVPYLYVPGNHDSPAVIERLKSLRNVTVLGDQVVRQKTVTVAGTPDPRSSQTEIKPLRDGAMAKEATETADRLNKLKKKPFILAVHDERLASRVNGTVPVILSGHTHKLHIKHNKDTILINAGTTGAAGLRTFQVEEGLPNTLNILYIDPKTPRLLAVDTVEVMGAEREFVLRRTLIEKDANGVAVP